MALRSYIIHHAIVFSKQEYCGAADSVPVDLYIRSVLSLCAKLVSSKQHIRMARSSQASQST